MIINKFGKSRIDKLEIEESKNGKFESGNLKLKEFLDEKSNEKKQSTNKPAKISLEDFYSSKELIEIQKKIINEIKPEDVTNINNQSELINEIKFLVNDFCDRNYQTITNKVRLMLIQSIADELTGFGPIQKLINDDSISEIMINGPKQIYVEKEGLILPSDVKFRDNDHVMNIIDKILSPLGRRLDESSPMVDARLPDGSRVNAIISPLSLIGPVVTVRKFSSTPLTIENVIAYKTLDENMAKFIEMAVKARLNIIVAGGTGSGKTTLLNVLSSFIFDDERIITIEDAAELKLMQPHVVSLESRPPNIEGKGQITIRDLVRNSLRMRPNRIIVGEVRGSEALDMIQAMNTGHEGSMSTVHSNSPRDTLSRISTMILYSGIDFPLKAIREQISSAIDLIIYLERLSDGSRRVTHITEVVGMENDTITLQDVFYFERIGIQDGKIQGEFKCSVVRPRILDKFKEQGMDIERW